MSLRRSNRSNKGTNKYMEALLREEQEQQNAQDSYVTEKDVKIANDGDAEYQNEDVQENHDDDFIDDAEDTDFRGTRAKKRHRTAPNKTNIGVKTNKRIKKDTGTHADKDLKLRQNAKKLFADLFAKFIIPDTVNANVYTLQAETSVDLLTEKVSRSLEEELYNACFDKELNQLNRYYAEKVRILYSNIKDPKNLTLKDHIINGKIAFANLVRMNTSELANPDLQHFKEEIDTKSLNKLIIEPPTEKPRWIKTHKGEELVEAQDEFKPENDIIFERDNIMGRGRNSEFMKVEEEKHEGGSGILEEPSEEPLLLSPKGEVHQHVSDDNITKATSQSMEVIVSYPEINNEFAGAVKYLGSSKELKENPYMTALGDGRLNVEGRLSKGRVLSYLNEMKSIRNFLLFSINPNKSKSPVSEENFISLHDFLIKNEKVIGIECKKKYEKNIYLIPTEYIGQSIIMGSVMSSDLSKNVVEDSTKLFMLIVIKPELL